MTLSSAPMTAPFRSFRQLHSRVHLHPFGSKLFSGRSQSLSVVDGWLILRYSLAMLMTLAACLLTGCSSPSAFRSAPFPTRVQLSGSLHGGQQPVAGASLQLFAVASTDAGAATPLLANAVSSDRQGFFTITGLYTCPSAGTQVYLTAIGGNPGLPGTISNAASGLMASLGPCGNLSAQTHVVLNEVTTVATVWSLAPFMSSYQRIGTSPSNQSLLEAATATINELVDLSTGLGPGSALPVGATAPVAKLNMLADMLATCINSVGGVAGDGSPCGRLFAASTPTGNSAPTNVLDAALQIAKNPSSNVSALYNLVSPFAPFQPTLSAEPADWTLSISSQEVQPLHGVAARLAFLHVPPEVTAHAIIPGLIVAVEDAYGAIVPGSTTRVSLGVASSAPGTLAGTTAASALAGSVTFSNVAFAGTSGTYALVATSPGLASATSGALTVTNSNLIATLHSEQASRADDFVDSIGINVHLHYTDTLYYSNWPLTFQAIEALGVRHTRDGVIDNALQAYYDRHEQLASAGIKGLFISSAAITPGMMQNFIMRVPHAFEAAETINEADSANDPAWIVHVKADLADKYPLAHSAGGFMVGPSLVQTSSPSLLGDVSANADFGNLHNYLGGRNPGTIGWGGPDALGHLYGSIPFALDNVANDTPGRGVFTTETGYSTDLAGTLNAVTEGVEAVYFPRLLLEQWNAGIQRTYIYELLDTEQALGIMHADGSAKPAYAAIAHLLGLLSDKGAAFTPASLSYSIAGAGSSMHHALFQKRDGSFWLALWIEASSYDPDQHVAIMVPTESVTLMTASPYAMTTYQLDATGAVTTTSASSAPTHSLSVSDHLLLIELTSN